MMTPQHFQKKTSVLTFSHAAQAQDAGDPPQQGQESAPRFYHIQTPIQDKSCTMYRYDIEGYLYGAGQPLDLTWVGYTYTNGLTSCSGVNRNQGQTQIKLDQYIRSGKLYLKFGPVNRYCNGFELFYQGHYRKQEQGLVYEDYKVFVTTDGNNLI